MPLSADEVRAFAADLESDRVERTMSTIDTEKFREAICAFANDLPGHGLPGYLFIGVENDGAIRGVNVTDQLLQKLADRRDDGAIQPIPTMSVYKVPMTAGTSVVVVEVQPAEAPPVRASGRTFIRVGPRRALASVEDERRLSERRIATARTFDQRPCPATPLGDLLLDDFRSLYLRRVVADDVLAQNGRTTEEQLASLRFYDLRAQAPTNAAVLVFGVDPLAAIPGAYIQFVRFDGPELAAPILDDKRLTGNLLTQLQELDNLLPIQLRVARAPSGGLRHDDMPDYPMPALRELVLNAVMHRSYDGSNAPVQIRWFSDRVEIQNPGGLYGQVRPENFGQATDYRNPVLAEAMRVLGYVDKFGVGIARTRHYLKQNGNPPPEFVFQPSHVLVVVKGRE